MKKLRESKLFKFITSIGISSILLTNRVQGAIVNEVDGGGDIQSSKLAQGLFNMIEDLTGTLQWLLPIVGVAICLFYIFKIATGDEQDQQRYKKSIVKVLVCIVLSLVAVSIVNLIAKYFVE